MQKIGFCDKYSLTQAVLNGTKTMTRRIEKELENLEEGNFYFNRSKCEIYLYGEKGSIIETIKTRYKLGEVVAVAQSYSTILNELEDPRNFDCMEHWESASAKRAHYAEYMQMEDCPGWTNKLFVSPTEMIHQIQITGVRIERLQDITDEDCLKEGIEYSKYERNWFYTNDRNTEFHAPSPRKAFAGLINRPGVGRKGLWESNPFVVVYEFKLVK